MMLQNQNLNINTEKKIFSYLKKRARSYKNLELCYRFIFDSNYYEATKQWNEFYVFCKVDGSQNQVLGDELARDIKKMINGNSYIDFYVYFSSNYKSRYSKYTLYRIFKTPEISFNTFTNNKRK